MVESKPYGKHAHIEVFDAFEFCLRSIDNT